MDISLIARAMIDLEQLTAQLFPMFMRGIMEDWDLDLVVNEDAATGIGVRVDRDDGIKAPRVDDKREASAAKRCTPFIVPMRSTDGYDELENKRERNSCNNPALLQHETRYQMSH